MLVSDKYKLIFLHIPRTAGTYVREVLKNLDPDVYEVGGYHQKAKNIRYIQIPKQTWSTYTKFTVVRNSWDWQVSLYLAVLVQGGEFQNCVVANMGFEKYLNWQRIRLDLQTDYIMTEDMGNCLVDKIISFENFLPELQHFLEQKVCRDITDALPQIKFKESGATKEYALFYNSHTRALVSEIHQKDIEYFHFI